MGRRKILTRTQRLGAEAKRITASRGGHRDPRDDPFDVGGADTEAQSLPRDVDPLSQANSLLPQALHRGGAGMGVRDVSEGAAPGWNRRGKQSFHMGRRKTHQSAEAFERFQEHGAGVVTMDPEVSGADPKAQSRRLWTIV